MGRRGYPQPETSDTCGIGCGHGKAACRYVRIERPYQQLFFGILLLDEQLKQNRLLQDDLGRTHKQVSDYMANGIATQSDLDAVSVEQLNAGQHRIELETSRQAYVNMLSAFIGKEIPAGTVFQKPAPESTVSVAGGINNRPELRLFEAQTEQLSVQEATLNARVMPRFGLFCRVPTAIRG